eukprot:5719044-Pyramimonas_sp.AAC.1
MLREANEIRDLREELNRITAAMTGATATATAGALAASAGQPAAPPYAWPNPTATMPATEMQMPL